jgi:nucleotide-binding universal stress UspA family protein
MTSAATELRKDRIVLVVGLGLDNASETLLDKVRKLTCRADEAELHVVHVAAPGELGERARWCGVDDRTSEQVNLCEINRLCQSFVPGTRGHIVVHTPAGRPVEELQRLAREVQADAIVVDEREAS